MSIKKTLAGTTLSLYIFTYSKNYSKKDTQRQSDYQVVIDHINKWGLVDEYRFETGKVQNKLHIHGTALMEDNLCYTTMKIKGFHSRWEKPLNLNKWIAYINKEYTPIEPDDIDLDEPLDPMYIHYNIFNRYPIPVNCEADKK